MKHLLCSVPYGSVLYDDTNVRDADPYLRVLSISFFVARNFSRVLFKL